MGERRAMWISRRLAEEPVLDGGLMAIFIFLFVCIFYSRQVFPVQKKKKKKEPSYWFKWRISTRQRLRVQRGGPRTPDRPSASGVSGEEETASSHAVSCISYCSL